MMLGLVNHVGGIDFAIVIVYLIGITIIGLWTGRKEKTTTDYYLAGRDMTWPFIAGSLFSSNVSAMEYVAFAGGAYAFGMVCGATEFIAPLTLAMLAFLFLPYYLKHQIFTIPEFLEKRYNRTAHTLMTVILLALNIFTRLTISLWAGALIVKTMAGWNTTTTIWVIGVVTTIYTLFGGLKAVIYTDTVQTIIMYVGGLSLMVLSLKAVGGWSSMVQQIPEGYMHWAKPLDHKLPWTIYTLPMFLGGLFYWCMDQTIVQRALAAKTLDHARKGCLFAAHIKIWHMFILVIPGLCALILFPNLEAADQAYPMMVAKLMPVGLKGLMLSVVLAAIMSTLSATLNSTATIIVRDIVLRFKPDTSQKFQVYLGGLIVLMMALAGMLWAPLMARFESMWIYVMNVSFYLQLPVVSVFMLGLMWKRTTAIAAVTGLIVGICFGGVCFMEEAGLISVPIINHWLLKSFAHRGLLLFVLSTLTAVMVTLFSEQKFKANISELTINWKNPQLLTAEPGPIWSDWRLWFFLLIVVDLFLYVKFM